jgi:hypothetical protein
MSAWEDACIAAAAWLLSQWPSMAASGIHQWGLDYPALVDVALPDVNGYGIGTSVRGLCGSGAAESGNATMSMTGIVLNGLGTIGQTAGSAPSFTTPDVVLVIPLTIDSLTASGTWSVEQGCSAAQDYTITGSGTFSAALTAANIVMTIGGLDMNAGSAGFVTLAWADATAAPPLKVSIVKPTVSGQPSGAPAPNAFAAQNFLILGLTTQLKQQLTALLTGAASLGSNRTLPGEVLSMINQGFQQISF